MTILTRKTEQTVLERTQPISLESLKQAISLKCANCYAAMAMCNALGGHRTGMEGDAWYLCHAHTLKELLAEADAQGLDLTGLRSSVDDIPVQDSLYYRRARGLITEEEFQALFRKWQKGE